MSRDTHFLLTLPSVARMAERWTVEHRADPALAPPAAWRELPVMTVRVRGSEPVRADTRTALAIGRPRARDGTDPFRWLLTDAPDDSWPNLAGAYAVLVIDTRERKVRIAADRFASHPVYVFEQAGDIVAGTDLAAVARASGADIAPQGLFDYIYHHNIPGPRTVFGSITKVLPAGRLEIDPTDTSLVHHWHPSFEADRHFDERAAADRLLDRLTEAVAADTADLGGQAGAFLSGGLDSSTVAGCIARNPTQEAHTFSIGFAAAERYNELPFARITAAHFGTVQHEYEVTPGDVVEALPIIAQSYAEPFGNSSAIPTYYCAKLARDAGFDVLVAGDGGDELFAGNERYGKQLALNRYGRFAGAVAIAAALARVAPFLPLAGKISSLKRQLDVGLPDRMQDYNFVHRLGTGAIFTPGFLAAVDTKAPIADLRARYQTAGSTVSDLNAMLFLDWKFTLADSDLPKVRQMCAAMDVEARFPLIADELVDFSLTIPDDFKLRRGELRYFYRRAMHGFLAPETLAKRKHGFGLPFGLWLHQDPTLSALVDDSLATLAGRGIFQPDFLTKTQALVRDAHAGYYGELAWILMMLEQWFRTHRPDYRFDG